MEPFSGWDLPIEQILRQCNTAREGLASSEAKERLKTYGANTLKPPARRRGLALLFNQFKSPLILLLVCAAVLSFFLGGKNDAAIIFFIVLASGLLGFYQERGAIRSLDQLWKLVAVKTEAWRDGKVAETPLEEIVPGDIICLKGGDLVPADCVLIESKRLTVDESTLTGESFPVEKTDSLESPGAVLLKNSRVLFMTSVVMGGVGIAVVVATGKQTAFGKMADQSRFKPPGTAFETGVRKFGHFLLWVTVLLTVAIFALNVLLDRPIIESFLFAVALAVGLTPQLLPAIITVNLSHGARSMSQKKVVIKRLPSIENFGQMDILCSDKTGTLTAGHIELDDAIGLSGESCRKVLLYGALNAKNTDFPNPLDAAILKKTEPESGWKKIDEIPYDYTRKRLTVLLSCEGRFLTITKGAAPQIFAMCSQAELADGKCVPFDQQRFQIERTFEEESRQGYRLLAVAYAERKQLDPDDKECTFAGFLRFIDPIKPNIDLVVEELKKRGVSLKIITGDHRLVALAVSSHIGLTHVHLATGEEILEASDESLVSLVKAKNVFAEIDPNQKERIVLALRKAGHVVGFLGDGVNDIAALHSADVSIAVDGGADAAKAVSDIVLLEKDLSVLRAGIEEGRRTFSNTLKYVYMAASANFGNMFSMAGISLFLPFLPLLPKQVLLTNLLTDFPEMAIAMDRVDAEIMHKPLKWNLKKIRSFMIVFGLISSVFDFVTFAVLLFWMHADAAAFRTGWFIESVASAALIVLAIRTKRFLFRSVPSITLALLVCAAVVAACALPWVTTERFLGFVPIPLSFYGMVFGIVMLYIASVETAKKIFYARLWNSYTAHG